VWRCGSKEQTLPPLLLLQDMELRVTVWVGKLFKINRPNIPLVADEMDRDFYTGWELRLH